MKAHHNYVFIEILLYIFFVYNVIPNSFFFFSWKKVDDFYEQSSQRISSAFGAYWNPKFHGPVLCAFLK